MNPARECGGDEGLPRADAPDAALLELVQRQTFRYFWEGAYPESGLAADRRIGRTGRTGPIDSGERAGAGSGERPDLVAIGGSGFGI
ncbi:MAG: hypothetical protein ACREUG_05300, partial [Steroidobacteraceae bacterium]